MGAIFISYRRDDSEGHAGRLYDDLARYFGNGSVFMDVADVEPGLDFRRVIDNQVSSCGVLLAVIGPGWLDAKDESGHRRLDNPTDFVRLETAAALKRGIPVVPVLVHGAALPKPQQLPADLVELAYRNALELSHVHWDSDIEVLIKSLRLPPQARLNALSRQPNLSRRVIIGGITVAIILAMAIAILSYLRRNSQPIIKVFDATPNEVTKGGTVAIRWEVTNADDVELEPGGQVVATGNTIDKPQSNTIYKLSATNRGGRKAGMFREVFVKDPNPSKVENEPSAAPKPVPPGGLNRPTTSLRPPPGMSAPVMSAPVISAPSPTSTSSAASPPDSSVPNLAGTWAEINPKDPAHPLRLKIVQTGVQIALYITYSQVFGNRAFLQTAISQGIATTSIPQSCAASFQHSGYSYDAPGQNIFSISLRGSTLVYEQDTKWTSPCGGHQIGVEKNIKELRQISQ